MLFPLSLLLSSALTASALAVSKSSSGGLDNATLALVRANAIASSTKSWELGTLAEALLELDTPLLSVVTTGAYPPPSNVTNNAAAVLTIASNVVAARPAGLLPLMVDGAVGDPASIGIAVLLANWTQKAKSNTVYADAATDQLNYLLNQAPRSPTGAISHRSDQVQLWADFVYMAPPFIAAYAVMQGGASEATLLQEAYNQCKLYRDVLFDPEIQLWRHILLGSWSDTTAWGTGNAWAAAGMMRVLETIHKSNLASSFKSQQKDLQNWINQTLTSAYSYQLSDGSLTNVINDPSTFSDTSTTALLSATVYRFAIFTKDHSLISKANLGLSYVNKNIDQNGWLLNAVDPYAFNVPLASGAHSPEGQSFILLLNAAYRDYQQYALQASIRLVFNLLSS